MESGESEKSEEVQQKCGETSVRHGAKGNAGESAESLADSSIVRGKQILALAKSMLQDQVTALLPRHQWPQVTWESLTEQQRHDWKRRAEDHLESCAKGTPAESEQLPGGSNSVRETRVDDALSAADALNAGLADQTQQRGTRGDIAVLAAEVRRLRKLFDDAGQGEHNVLALVDHYQSSAIEAESEVRRLRAKLARVEALPAKWRLQQRIYAIEAGAFREAADDLEAALKDG